MNKLKVLWASLLAIWAGLDHHVQAALIFGGSAALESIGHAVSEGQFPSTLLELKHFALGAATTGGTAAWAFYQIPNGKSAPFPSLPPDVPKA